MNTVPGLPDHILLAAAILFSLANWRWLWPRFLRELASGADGVRASYYRKTAASEWLFSFVILAVWTSHQRPWMWLSIWPVSPLRLGAGLGLVVVLGLVMRMRNRALIGQPERLERLRPKLAFAEPMLPHTTEERSAFRFLSMTAGICEEFIFRGFVMWYFAARTGPALALLLSSVVFGLGHLYLSPLHVVRTAIVGGILGGLVLATGSLLPAMIIHVLLDINGGDLGFTIFSSTTRSAGAAVRA